MDKFIKKDNWRSDFVLIGKPVIKDWTYKIDEVKESSKWKYSVLNLDLDCGEKYGIIRAEMMGGFSTDPTNSNTIYAHGKNDDGSDNWADSIKVDWDDRFNAAILDSVGNRSFITVGLELTTEGEVFEKKFLSAYDAIAYINQHLTENMIVEVRGKIKYSAYNGKVSMKKDIESVKLVKPKTDAPIERVSKFTQSILIDKYSADLKNIDAAKGVMYVTARVLDYVKEVNGVTVKGQYPYYWNFEYPVDASNPEQCQLIYDALFNVEKDITQITFNGNFIESGATVVPTFDDLADNIKLLVKAGVYTLEYALQTCSTNGGKEKRMVLGKPHIKMVGEQKTPVLQVFPEKYTEDDLDLNLDSYAVAADDAAADDDAMPFDADATVSNDAVADVAGMDWLKAYTN